ncbi:MAG: type III-A CRISPR-associated protein Cas10/Csm1 [Bacteroidia bacterium]|nr:type III-A CRISPR-associated protein Cas10/Csm1 [Bacteroidia bacterium]
MNSERQLTYIAALLSSIRSAEDHTGSHDALSLLKHKLSQVPVLQNDVDSILEYLADTRLIQAATRIVAGTSGDPEKPSLLRSVFSSLSLTGRHNQRPPFFNQPHSISISDYQFPDSSIALTGEDILAQHRSALDRFWTDHEDLRYTHSQEAYASSLLSLLYKHGSRLPAPFHYPTQDVSLYDHARLTAAVANCFSLSSGQLESPSFIFLIGDLSGLQKFIYSHIDTSEAGDGKGLAKRLRGRSYYIALLTDVIAERLAEAFDVNDTNILYAGGGGFQLLLPRTADYKERIANFTQKTNQFLFEKIGGRIGLITGYAEADQSIFQQSSPFIQQAYDHIGEEKARKFEANLDYLFFERPKQVDNTFKDDEKLGGKIPYGRLILEIEASNLRLQQGELFQPQASLEALDRYFFILDERRSRSDIEADTQRIIKAYRDQARSFRLLSINDTDFLSSPAVMMRQLPEVDIRAGFRFIGSYAPQESYRGNDGVITFEQLAKRNNVDEGDTGELSYPKLAVMRLDVDNLGALFASGLGVHASFVRVATLSRELHLFFSGYFNELAKKYSLYVTYSGGDDAFVVGSWLNVMHAAAELHDDFQRFTCKNPELSFSAGIFMCSEYYPVVKFAKKAEEAESKAKNFTSQGQEKDAICVFDHALSWTQYKEMLRFAQTILKYVEQANESDRNKLSRSLIHRIHQIVKRCIKDDGSIHLPRLYQQTARLHYLFARQTVVTDGFTHQFLERTATKATSGDSLNDGEQIAQHIIRVFLDYFTKPGCDKDGKNGILGNLIVPTSYVTYKTRTTEN